MSRAKLPKDPRRKQQVKTFTERFGREEYARRGKLGSQKSPTKFNSETGKRAVQIREAKRAARLAAEQQNNEKGA